MLIKFHRINDDTKANRYVKMGGRNMSLWRRRDRIRSGRKAYHLRISKLRASGNETMLCRDRGRTRLLQQGPLNPSPTMRPTRTAPSKDALTMRGALDSASTSTTRHTPNSCSRNPHALSAPTACRRRWVPHAPCCPERTHDARRPDSASAKHDTPITESRALQHRQLLARRWVLHAHRLAETRHDARRPDSVSTSTTRQSPNSCASSAPPAACPTMGPTRTVLS